MEELNAKGAQFFRDGHMEPARLHFIAALLLEPNQPQVLQNLGAVLRNLNHFAAAESVAKRSVDLSNGDPYCRSNLGVSQLALRKYTEALTTLFNVTKDLPDTPYVWHNYGLALYMLGRYREALAAFDKSLGMDGLNTQCLSDRALTLLSLGELEHGLAAYEARWAVTAKSKIWSYGIPEWQGEFLAGIRLLVHHEQGYGDSLMLVRFVQYLVKQRADVTLAVPQALVRLFRQNFRDIRVVDWDEPSLENTAAFDYHTPLLSLMRWLNIKTPTQIDARPYLRADPLRATVDLPDLPFKIGICWASGNHGPLLRERRRVVPLPLFLPLSEIPGVSLVSLQVGPESADISANGMEGIVFDLSHRLEDFSITADLIARLNLVISVDSAVAHLAGALGKPCLMLSPFSRCWRWWNKTSGWPWYERMAVFSQSQNGTWDEAMWRVTKATRTHLK